MIDKRLLVDSVTIKKALSLDEWGNRTYSNPLRLNAVRFDRTISTSMATSTAQQKNLRMRQSGTLYVYPYYTPMAFDESWVHAIVNDGVRDYEVVAIHIHPYPFQDKIFSYELDVI